MLAFYDQNVAIGLQLINKTQINILNLNYSKVYMI